MDARYVYAYESGFFVVSLIVGASLRISSRRSNRGETGNARILDSRQTLHVMHVIAFMCGKSSEGPLKPWTCCTRERSRTLM